MRKKRVIILSSVIIFAFLITAVILIRLNTDISNDYVEVTATLSQRTDYTNPQNPDESAYQREYIFRYSLDNMDYYSKVMVENPDNFPLKVGDKTTIFVNKTNPKEIILPDKTVPLSLFDYVVHFITRDKKYR